MRSEARLHEHHRLALLVKVLAKSILVSAGMRTNEHTEAVKKRSIPPPYNVPFDLFPSAALFDQHGVWNVIHRHHQQVPGHQFSLGQREIHLFTDRSDEMLGDARIGQAKPTFCIYIYI